MNPFIQGVDYTTRVRALTGFAARVRQGYYGRDKRVPTGTVIGAIMAIRQEIALVCGTNPTKVTGREKLLPRIAQTLDGWRKEGPPTTKQLSVKADVPELLAEKGCTGNTTELNQAIGDLTLIVFYLLPAANRGIYHQGHMQ